MEGLRIKMAVINGYCNSFIEPLELKLKGSVSEAKLQKKCITVHILTDPTVHSEYSKGVPAGC